MHKKMRAFLRRILKKTFSRLKRISYKPVTKLDKKALHEILLRVDPNTIFDCILVNKECLEIITDTEFRRSYNRRWKNVIRSPDKVVGFFKYGADLPFQLLATTKFGSAVNETKLPAGLGHFIAKSSSGDGLILCGVRPAMLFIFNLTSGSVLRRLPPPPANLDNPAVAILSSYNVDESFTVIFASTDDDEEIDGQDYETLLRVQTFSSSTNQWEETTCKCPMYFSLTETGEPGVVCANGLVYFRGTTVNYFGCIVIYNPRNHGVEPVFQPGLMQFSAVVNRDVYHAYYDVCSTGMVRAATRRAYTNEDWKTGFISIWDLQNDGIHEVDWKISSQVNPAVIWSKNEEVLGPIFRFRPKTKAFDFVSFAPGRSKSIYLRLGNEIFLYHLDTEKLELYGPKYYLSDSTGLLPVTLAESGAWPSFPMSRLVRSLSKMEAPSTM